MISKLVLCALLSVRVAAAPASAPVAAAANPTIIIPAGVVVGTVARVSSQPSNTNIANAYLGIPFASPPVRFAPPSPPRPFQTLQAQNLMPACLQQGAPKGGSELISNAFYDVLLDNPSVDSEDCLYLNVYAPRKASLTNLKAVLFWIHGGNLDTGGSSQTIYDGSSLAVNEDVVVVTINYRLNIFGFSNSPEIPLNQQNSGFLDQRFALQWVHDNIKSFGGDPQRVTIAGESAGGFSVKQLIAQPPSPLPFRAAIIESHGKMSLGNPADNLAKVIDHFNCSSAPSHVACLRKVSGRDIQSYIIDAGLFFGPVKDTTNVDHDSLPSIQSGRAADVPIIIGTNAQELSLSSALSDLQANVLANVTLGVFDLFGLDISAVLKPLEVLYDQKHSIWPLQIFDRILTDLIFTCPTHLLSSAFAKSKTRQQPIWRYFYEGDFPNARLFPHAGAYHTSEIPMVFGTYPLQNALGPVTPTQIAMSAAMQQIWGDFVKNPAAGPGWPQVGSSFFGIELGVLGGQKRLDGMTVEPMIHADLGCPILEPLILAGQLAY
ncbi:alpha/beta-hydrolase [Dissoconium aciculare CBS 342.82]|uniref:Carboxylic ester hydrolase n=1 Tax=Dissoconium aciculare CBS 342.82 TaxID=1314786 RepID=A0A6J3MI51_9PEZI|nr:alpha/beta-hydrolase [Dissoconium aciculare CBS 342.82]KAF1827590.1 alpha/beta-hydrolase [Dissoconium aciculare CBS 342.82]